MDTNGVPESSESSVYPGGRKGEYVYKLAPSVHDVAILLFVDPEDANNNAISPVDSVVTLILYICNIIIQVLFTAIIFVQGEVLRDEVSGQEFHENALAWRVVKGHHTDNYDPISNSSLVTRVCAQYGAEVISQDQMESYSAITRYLDGNMEQEKTLFGKGYGWLLSLLAIVLWTAGIATEFRAIFEFFHAVMGATNGTREKTLLLRECGEDGKFTGNYVLREVWPLRKLIMGLGALLRFGIAAVLWWAGVLWLTYTVELNDIILNCVALGFVLNCDEALYTLVPRNIMWVREKLKELKLRRWCKPGKKKEDSYKGFPAVDYTSLILVLGLVVTVLGWYFGIHRDFKQQLRTSQDLFCGGQQNFIYAQDPATKEIRVAMTVEGMDKKRPDVLDAVLQKAWLHKEDLEMREDLQADLEQLPEEDLYQTSDIADVRQLDMLTPEAAMNEAQCANIDTSLPGRRGMEIALGISDCESARKGAGCGNWTVRTFCPITCGCHQVDSGIYNQYGCSFRCSGKYREHTTKKREEAERNKRCKDNPQSDQDEGWDDMFFREVQQRLLEKGHLSTNATTGLTTFATEFVDAATLRMGALAFAKDENGEVRMPVNISHWWKVSVVSGWECRLVVYLRSLFQINLCEAADGFGSLAAFCPRTCGWCGSAMPEVDWVQMAWELKALTGEPLLTSEKMDALEAATPLSACTRPGGAWSASSKSNISADELHYRFLVQHAGRYTFSVQGSQGLDSQVSIWDARSLEELYENDDFIGHDPCLKVDAQAGQELLIVIGSKAGEEEGGHLSGQVELLVECPWHRDYQGLHVECPLHPAPGEELGQAGTFSLQDTDCESAGLYRVLEPDCQAAARQLGLVFEAGYVVQKHRSWVPYGCSYDEIHHVLYVDGTGIGGGSCGDTVKCMCSSLQQRPQYNRFASGCNKDIAGACKACVESVDPFCKDNPWDSMCTGLCRSNCELLCGVPLEAKRGECSVEWAGGDWCISSESYPSAYAHSSTCEIPVGLKTYGPMRVEYFSTELDYDVLTVNGIEFSGPVGPVSIVPTSTITWSSDASVADSGWKICFAEESCVDSAEGAATCAELAVSSWTCSTEYDSVNFRALEMCCHCGGGSAKGGGAPAPAPPGEACWQAGSEVAIEPGTRYADHTSFCGTLTSDICEGAGSFAITWQDGHTGFYEYEDLKLCIPSVFTVAGPCRQTTDMDEENFEWCITSDWYPSEYGNNVNCEITVGLLTDADGIDLWGPSEIRVEAFSTEEDYDILTLNYEEYSGSSGPAAVYPVTINWQSDLSVTDQGWKVCASMHQWSCRNTAAAFATNLLGQDCAALEASNAMCTSEHDTENFQMLTMCCWCDGGELMPTGLECWPPGARVRIRNDVSQNLGHCATLASHVCDKMFTYAIEFDNGETRNLRYEQLTRC